MATRKKTPLTRTLMAACSVAVLSLAMYGCVHSGGSDTVTEAPEPMPTPYETAEAAIEAAETVAAAQAAYDAASMNENVSAPQLATLREARDARVATLNMASARADRQKLVDAAECTDATAACRNAHQALVSALKADLDALKASDEATNAEEQDAQMAYDAAKMTLDDIVSQLADIDRTTATGMAVAAAETAASGLETDRSAEDIAAAKAAIEAAEMAVGDSEDYDDRIAAANMAVDRAEELNMVDAAVMAASDAASGLAEDSSETAVTKAQGLIDAAKMAVDDAEHLMGDEEADYRDDIANAQLPVTVAKKKNDDAAEQERTAEAEAEAAADKVAAEMMAATAAKLYAAISPASGAFVDEGTDTRVAQINPVSADDSTPFIGINYGGVLATAGQANTVSLNLDKDTTVPANHGWKGNRYVEKNDDEKIITEAYVYSDEMPMMGGKFNGGETGDDAVGFSLDDGTSDTVTLTTELNLPARIASSRFTHTAGTHTFEIPEGTPGTPTTIDFPGSYYGVAGTYTCTPETGACSVVRGANGGYTFGNPTAWAFKATDPNARVMDAADTLYAVYGWWLRTPAGNGAWTASAFADYYGTPAETPALNDLNGSATYTGGAAGKYALSSSTGGDNDAGHFTARAMLEADFDTEMITGTIDQFMGVGGAKDWSVALMKSGFSATGQILGEAGVDDSTAMKTVWTKDGTAAAASGHWKGNFREVTTPADGGNGVPAVVTGDFYSEFGNSGKMVGAFGAKTE